MGEGDPSTLLAANASGETAAPNDVTLFDEGVQALKDNKFERAVQVLGEALQLRIDKYGERDLETASAYYRYGCALFYRAQEESDVFGAQLRSTVTAREEGSSGLAGAAKQEDAGKKPEEAASKTIEAADPKGKAVAQPPAKEQEEGVESGEDADDSAEEEEEPEDDDIELSWKMLEVARTIYLEQGGTHKSELADVHVLLADHSTEQENYETALEDLKRALVLLQAELKEDDRQLAALHYKIGLALQSMDKPREALAEIKVANRICQERLGNLREQSQEAKEVKEEVDDLEAVMEELVGKEQELVEAGKELQKAKDSLRSLFQGAMGGTAIARPADGGQVIDLGVAGQGRKRIDATTTQVVRRGGEPAAGKGPGADAAAKQAKPKRTLEDLMGVDAAPKFSFQPSTAAEGLAAKKARTELQEHNGQSSDASAAADKPAEAAKPQTLPGFLQPRSVQAVYGNQEKGTENGNQTAEQ